MPQLVEGLAVGGRSSLLMLPTMVDVLPTGCAPALSDHARSLDRVIAWYDVTLMCQDSVRSPMMIPQARDGDVLRD